MSNLANISFWVVFVIYILFYHTINEIMPMILRNVFDVSFIIYATKMNKYYGFISCLLLLFMKHNKIIEGAAVGTNVRNLSGDIINITDLIEKHIENIKQGPAGPQGEKGLTGPQGKEGPAGPQGEKGLIGPQGEKGLIGPQGEKGFAGPKGEQGNTGPRGKQGPQGEQGPQGPIGLSSMEGFSEYR